ncbi:MAG TPA: metallophosphoesterase [Isosphaeraceae bacterium]|jgi:3',5'-cyclic AMP phosphodiesterase CpdA
MKVSRVLIAACLVANWSALTRAQEKAPAAPGPEAKPKPAAAAKPQGPFLAKPYLQLGGSQAPGKLLVLWHATDSDAPWAVDVRTPADRAWKTVKDPKFSRVAVAGIEPHRVYRATVKVDEPGGVFTYRVRKGEAVLFEAEAHAPKSADQTHRFAVFGDCGADTPEQRLIAYRAFLSRPDFVMITGDIVYGKGLISEYRDKFWPVYNADDASPSTGVPLLRSTLFLAAPGNHDIASRDLGKTPDGLAYYYYWYQPHNGPIGKEGGPTVAPLVGPEANRRAFLEAAGNSFPRMANFSFDYGNAHWTVLDANATVDWTDRELRDWVARDLEAAKDATWRFVSFHQPGFSSSKKHFDEQYMRILAPIFEVGKVDLVFSGHVHNYQRTYPLRFAPAAENGASAALGADGKPAKVRHVDGKLALDRRFDGRADTTPEGVIYVVSGAGGQNLYNPEQQDDPASWQEFTYKHISKVHSLTVVDVDGKILTVRQVTPGGEEVDRFIVTR